MVLPSPTKIWTPQRAKVRDWLTEKRPVLGETYAAFILLLEQPRFPGRAKLIAHAAREIILVLVDHFVGSEAEKASDDQAKEKAASWTAPIEVTSKEPSPLGPATTDPMQEYQAPVQAEAASTPKESVRQDFAERIARLYIAIQVAPGAAHPKMFEAQAKLVNADHNKFTKAAHERLRADAEAISPEFLERCERFERFLEGIASSTEIFAEKGALDAILAATN